MMLEEEDESGTDIDYVPQPQREPEPGPAMPKVWKKKKLFMLTRRIVKLNVTVKPLGQREPAKLIFAQPSQRVKKHPRTQQELQWRHRQWQQSAQQ